MYKKLQKRDKLLQGSDTNVTIVPLLLISFIPV